MQICEAAEIQFSDLVAWAHSREEPTWILTPAQEEYFLENHTAFRVFEDISFRKLSSAESQKRRNLAPSDLRKILEKLEALDLIEATGRASIRIVPRGSLAFRADSLLLKSLQKDMALRILTKAAGKSGLGSQDEIHAREWMATPQTLRRFQQEISKTLGRMEEAASREEAVLSRTKLKEVSFFGGWIVQEDGSTPKNL